MSCDRCGKVITDSTNTATEQLCSKCKINFGVDLYKPFIDRIKQLEVEVAETLQCNAELHKANLMLVEKAELWDWCCENLHYRTGYWMLPDDSHYLVDWSKEGFEAAVKAANEK